MRVFADNPLICKREVWATECIGAPDLPFMLYVLNQAHQNANAQIDQLRHCGTRRHNGQRSITARYLTPP